MKLGFVRVFVSDFERALRFYVDQVGMELDHQDPRFGWAQFRSGEDVSLAIERTAPGHVEAGSRLVGRYTGITLMVDDIAATFERLREKGVELTGAPEKQPWGGTLAHFKDPDGNVLTLMQEA